MRRLIKIEELGRIITGSTPPTNKSEYFGKDYLFIKPSDINKESRITYNTETKISEAGAEVFKTISIPKGSTCVVCIGSIGEKLTYTNCLVFTNQQINSIIPNVHFDNKYVFYLIKNNLYKLKAANQGSSSGRENVSKRTFGNIVVEIEDSIVHQKKISSILSAYDDLIENNQKQIKLLEEAAQRLYKEWFVDLRFPGYENVKIVDGVPEGWSNIKIDDMFQFKYGKNISTSVISNKGKYAVYGANGRIGYYNEKNCDDYVVLVTSRGNGSGDVMRTHEKNSFVTNNSFIVKPYDSSIGISFVYQLMKYSNFKSICSGSAQPQLTNNAIRLLSVLFPERHLIYAYCKYADKCISAIDQLLMKNDLLKEARDRLLPKLMSGEIEV